MKNIKNILPLLIFISGFFLIYFFPEPARELSFFFTFYPKIFSLNFTGDTHSIFFVVFVFIGVVIQMIILLLFSILISIGMVGIVTMVYCFIKR